MTFGLLSLTWSKEEQIGKVSFEEKLSMPPHYLLLIVHTQNKLVIYHRQRKLFCGLES